MYLTHLHTWFCGLALVVGLCLLPSTAWAQCSSTFLSAFGSNGTANGQFNQPVGVAVNAAGNILVADGSNHRIQVFSPTGAFLFAFGSNGSGNGQFNLPGGVAVNAAGNILVADSSNHRIQVFSPTGAFLFAFGSFGSGNGQFATPTGVAVNAADNILVADYNNQRIQVFSPTGAFLFAFGSNGSGNGQFNQPIGVGVNAAGNILVADYNNHRIQVFSPTGAFLFAFGSNGSGNGQFQGPTGVAVNAAGNILVADYGNHRIQVFSSTGAFLFAFGSNGTGNGQFHFPQGVAVNAAGNILVADRFNNRIQVFQGCPNPPNVTVQAADPALCLDPGGLVGVTATVTNPNALAFAASFTATLPTGLTAVAGTCAADVNPGGCTIAPGGGSVTWNGTLNPGQTVTLIYRARIAATVGQGASLTIQNQGIVGGAVTNFDAVVNVNCPTLVNARVSDQKAGSVLVFPYYTSTIGGASDTRMTISNISNAASTVANQAYVHLFFIDGTTCQQADVFVCLTPGASIAFKASEYDPGNTGYLLAVAVDKNGVPVQNNVLIGNAFVRTPTLSDNYGAESFAANSFAVAAVTGNTATLFFDQVGYDAVPKQFAVEVQSPLDAVGQQVVTAGLSGDLNAVQITGAAQVGTAQAFNEKEQFASFQNWLTGTCQARGTIATNSPRVPNGLGNLIKTGQSGHLKFNVGAAVGVLLTPRGGAWTGIRTLHKTQTTTTSLTIPIFVPVC